MKIWIWMGFFCWSLLPMAGAADTESAIQSFRRVSVDELTGIEVPVGYPDNRAEAYAQWQALWEKLPASEERDSYQQEYRFVDGESMRKLQGPFPDSFLLISGEGPTRPPRLSKATVQQPALFEWGCDGSKIPVLRLARADPGNWQATDWAGFAIDVPSSWPLPKAEWHDFASLPIEVIQSDFFRTNVKSVADIGSKVLVEALKLTWEHQARQIWIVKVTDAFDSSSTLFELTGVDLRSLPLGEFWIERC